MSSGLRQDRMVRPEAGAVGVTAERADRIVRATLILAAMVFILTGIDAHRGGNALLGTSSLVVAAVNLVAVRFAGARPSLVVVGLQVLNAAFCLLTSYSQFQAGKTGLPYASIGAGLMFLVAASVTYRKIGRDQL